MYITLFNFYLIINIIIFIKKIKYILLILNNIIFKILFL